MHKFLKNKISLFLNIKYFTVINIFVFVAKIIYSVRNDCSDLHFEDWKIAHNIAIYGVYSEFMEVGATAYKPPVYSLFLSIFVALFPENLNEVAVIVQHILLFVVSFLIIKILTIFDRKNVGIFAGYLLLYMGFTILYMIGCSVNTRFKLDFEWTQFLLIGLFLSDIQQKINKRNFLNLLKSN